MAKKRPTSQSTDSSKAPTGSPKITAKNLAQNLFAETNRGMLFDILIFLANIFLMRYLTGLFIDLFQMVSAEDIFAKLGLSLTAVAMWILPALGAVLKRRQLHRRLKEEGRNFDPENSMLAGCLFNPIFYFCLNLVLTAAIMTGLAEVFFGKRLVNNEPLFVSFVIVGFILTVIQTILIYLYFLPPKKPARIAFLNDPRSEGLGDICLFLNMILFQVAWNLLAFADLGSPSSALEFGGRLFVLCFLALLIYFPPRMFYLAEDIHRPRTWLTMLLANSPVILRLLFGAGSSTMMWN